ncbi:PilZ domain-containing protein [bacterium]|nr:PilZ domain-containing protein [bacterium]
MNREHRHHLRIPICRKAWIRQDGVYRRALTIDLHDRGAQLSLDREMTVETLLDFQLKLAEGAPISLQARVVWSRYEGRGLYRLGLAFVEQNSIDARRLSRWHHVCRLVA